MTSEPELLAFLAGFALAPNSKLDEVLEPAISFERELRRLFADEPEHSRLRHPFMGLLSVFDIPEYPHTLRARPRTIPTIPDEESGRTGNEQFIFPLPDQKRYSKDEPITVGSFEAFLHSWQIFSEGSLQEINWDNVVVAGGSVLACISPVPKEFMSSKRSLREYFQQKEYLSSDIDLFLWGLSQSEVCLIIVHTGNLPQLSFYFCRRSRK